MGKCAQYGDSYIVLKDVRLRSTFSPEDSANLKANRLAVLDYYAHVLYEYSDDELKETIEACIKGTLGDSKVVAKMKYKEAQIHGEVNLDHHVERIVVAERHRKAERRITSLAEKHKWTILWADEERKRLESD